MSSDSIAIVGAAGRFPGAGSIEQLWERLVRGEDCVRRLEPVEEGGARFVPAAGVLDGVELFDADRFGISAREATYMDPQHRLFLELAHDALQDACLDPRQYDGRIGVHAGCSSNSYAINVLMQLPDLADVHDMRLLTGNDLSYMVTRLAYKLDLRGPATFVQTACSTSLMAVHVASEALIAGECDVSIAGGVCVRVPQIGGIPYVRGGLFSPAGTCRAYDADADGTVAGSGGGLVVLMRLDEAIELGLPVRAVLRGSAANNDGSTKVGFTAPSVAGQADVIEQALAVSGIGPRSISYVEGHGTGTPVGDSIELAALERAWRPHTAGRAFCGLGSVKTNIGHLDAASGVAGLIKVMAALEHRTLPPSLNFDRPRPDVDLEASPFFVVGRAMPWSPGPGGVRRAGVSSFGVGGTNVHAIVEEAPRPREAVPVEGPHLFVVSAATRAGLTRQLRALADAIESGAPDLAEVALTLAVGRPALGWRAAFVAATREELVRALREAARSGVGSEVPPNPRRVALVLANPGTDSEALSSLREEPAFGRTYDRVLGAAPNRSREAVEVAVLVACDALLRSWGLRPAAVGGDRAGLWAAASVAGVHSEAAALGGALLGRPDEIPSEARLPLWFDGTPPPEAVAWSGPPAPDDPWLCRVAEAFGTGENPRARLLEQMAAGWCAGADIDPARRYRGMSVGRVRLPAQPLQRTAYWAAPTHVEPRPRPTGARVASIDWRVDRSVEDSGGPVRWRVLGDGALAAEVRRHLVEAGDTLVDAGRADRIVFDATGLSIETCYTRLAALGRELLQPSHPGRLVVATSGLASVAGEGAVDPTRSLLFGAVDGLLREVPALDAALVDVVDPASAADRLIRFARASAGPPVALLRRRARWIPVLQDCSIEPSGPAFARGDVVLITGGTGEVALAVARGLVERYGVRLALLARTDLPPRAAWPGLFETCGEEHRLCRRIRAVQALEDAGGEVLWLRADVSDGTRLERAVAGAVAHFGRLDGVVHAAGISSETPLLRQAWTHTASVFAPKVSGTHALLAAVAPHRPSVMVLCSSVLALAGGAGQAAYVSANAYLNALATEREESEPRTVSIAWDRWAGVGMARPRRRAFPLRTRRSDALSVASEAIRALGCEQDLAGAPAPPVLGAAATCLAEPPDGPAEVAIRPRVGHWDFEVWAQSIVARGTVGGVDGFHSPPDEPVGARDLTWDAPALPLHEVADWLTRTFSLDGGPRVTAVEDLRLGSVTRGPCVVRAWPTIGATGSVDGAVYDRDGRLVGSWVGLSFGDASASPPPPGAAATASEGLDRREALEALWQVLDSDFRGVVAVLRSESGASRPARAPRTPSPDRPDSPEAILMRIVEEELGVQAVDPDADLLALGADSIVYLHIAGRAREAGIPIPEALPIGGITVRGILASLGTVDSDGRDAPSGFGVESLEPGELEALGRVLGLGSEDPS